MTVIKIENESEGAIDNASGVGVLLEVARAWISRNTEEIPLHIIFTGAEEMGLLGSLMFQKRWGKKMVREEAYLINIDSLGKRGKIRICSSGKAGKQWVKEVLACSRERGIPLRPLPFLKGIMMDHLPFCHFGIPAISFTSVSNEGWYLHTRQDRFSLVQKEGLAEMGKLIVALVDSLRSAGRKAADP